MQGNDAVSSNSGLGAIRKSAGELQYSRFRHADSIKAVPDLDDLTAAAVAAYRRRMRCFCRPDDLT